MLIYLINPFPLACKLITFNTLNVFFSLKDTSNLFYVVRSCEKRSFFFMAWKLFSNVSIYICSIILDHVHDHLDGKEWYFWPS
jgi:Na+/melibiose symporter-like transporter